MTLIRYFHLFLFLYIVNIRNISLQVKNSMREIARTAWGRIQDEHDMSELKHPEWVKKIKEIEHNLLLGVISCLAYGVDAIMDVDQLLDEYCAGMKSEDTSEKRETKK